MIEKKECRFKAWSKSGCLTGLPSADPVVHGVKDFWLEPDDKPWDDMDYMAEYVSGSAQFKYSDAEADLSEEA